MQLASQNSFSGHWLLIGYIVWSLRDDNRPHRSVSSEVAIKPKHVPWRAFVGLVLKVCWAHVGSMLGCVGPMLGHLRPVLCPYWPILALWWAMLDMGLCWAYVGPCWAQVSQLSRFWASQRLDILSHHCTYTYGVHFEGGGPELQALHMSTNPAAPKVPSRFLCARINRKQFQ